VKKKQEPWELAIKPIEVNKNYFANFVGGTGVSPVPAPAKGCG
jgi:hypothetical protein